MLTRFHNSIACIDLPGNVIHAKGNLSHSVFVSSQASILKHGPTLLLCGHSIRLCYFLCILDFTKQGISCIYVNITKAFRVYSSQVDNQYKRFWSRFKTAHIRHPCSSQYGVLYPILEISAMKAFLTRVVFPSTYGIHLNEYLLWTWMVKPYWRIYSASQIECQKVMLWVTVFTSLLWPDTKIHKWNDKYKWKHRPQDKVICIKSLKGCLQTGKQKLYRYTFQKSRWLSSILIQRSLYIYFDHKLVIRFAFPTRDHLTTLNLIHKKDFISITFQITKIFSTQMVHAFFNSITSHMFSFQIICTTTNPLNFIWIIKISLHENVICTFCELNFLEFSTWGNLWNQIYFSSVNQRLPIWIC